MYEIIEKAAFSGDAEAQTWFAAIHIVKDLTEFLKIPNYELAYFWFTEATKQKNPAALCALGDFAKAVNRLPRIVISYYKKSAKNKFEIAKRKLAAEYENNCEYIKAAESYKETKYSSFSLVKLAILYTNKYIDSKN